MKAIEPSRALQIVTQNEPLPERDRIAIATSDSNTDEKAAV